MPTSLSTGAGSLCLELVRQRFGPHVAAVAASLIRVGPNTLAQLSHLCRLRRDKVIRCLAALIQHSLVTYHIDNAKGVCTYRLWHERVVRLCASPRVALCAKQLYGDASELLCELLLVQPGCGLDTLFEQLGHKFDRPTIHQTLCSLLSAHFVCLLPAVQDNQWMSSELCLQPELVQHVNPFQCPLMPESSGEVASGDGHVKSEPPSGTGKRKLEPDSQVPGATPDSDPLNYTINWDRFERYFRDQLVVEAVKAANLHDEVLRCAAAEGSVSRATAERCLSAVSDDPSPVLRKIGDAAGGLFVIDFERAAELACAGVVQRIVAEKHDTKGVRIMNLLCQHGYLEQTDIEQRAMFPAKDSKELLYSLLADGYVFVKEFCKGTDFAPNRTFYLFYVDWPRVALSCRELLYKCLLNALRRRAHETQSHSALLERKNKLDTILDNIKNDTEIDEETKQQQIADVDAAYMTAGERDTLAKSERSVHFLSQLTAHLARVWDWHQVDNLQADQVRAAAQVYETAKKVVSEREKVKAAIERQTGAQLPGQLKRGIDACTTLDQLNLTYAPYKAENKGTLAARAKKLGLEQLALDVLGGAASANDGALQRHVRQQVKGLSNVEEVRLGLQHIMADCIMRNEAVIELLKSLAKDRRIRIQTAPMKGKASKEVKQQVRDNFHNYANFDMSIGAVQPHQLLAIRRAEALKVYTIKTILPDFMCTRFCDCARHEVGRRVGVGQSAQLWQSAVEDCWKRLAEPFVVAIVRSTLWEDAQKSALETFACNLRHLLLTPPVKGCHVLAVDPGFTHGCKMALIDLTGSVLYTGKFYLSKNGPSKDDTSVENTPDLKRLRDFLTDCGDMSALRIAIGDGKGSREAETLMSRLIERRFFGPVLDVKFWVRDCPLGDMEPNLRSAVSLARRLQDPLSELVKVDPKHLGIGMYQHDMPAKRLSGALDSVVSECVSFVGVDVNTCSRQLLARVAGLTDKRAMAVLAARAQVPIVPPEDAAAASEPPSKKRRKVTQPKNDTLSQWEPLDATNVHPESYHIAEKVWEWHAHLFEGLLAHCQLRKIDLGSPAAAASLKSLRRDDKILEPLCTRLKCQIEEAKQVIDALVQPKNDDYRKAFPSPVFRSRTVDASSVSSGTVLSGRVVNATSFGVFVDCGLGTNGLAHSSRFGSVPRDQLVLVGGLICPMKGFVGRPDLRVDWFDEVRCGYVLWIKCLSGSTRATSKV